MPTPNKTPCCAVPNTVSKEELKELHRARQALRKAALKHERSIQVFRVARANLSKDHPNSGKHPKETY